MAPAPGSGPEPEALPYPPGLPAEFDPVNVVRTGTHMLEHGLLPLPEVLTRDMSVPVAYWKARQCAVVLTLAFAWYGHDQPEPMAMEVVYSRGEDGQ